jgi:hypothetical protein
MNINSISTVRGAVDIPEYCRGPAERPAKKRLGEGSVEGLCHMVTGNHSGLGFYVCLPMTPTGACDARRHPLLSLDSYSLQIPVLCQYSREQTHRYEIQFNSSQNWPYSPTRQLDTTNYALSGIYISRQTRFPTAFFISRFYYTSTISLRL